MKNSKLLRIAIAGLIFAGVFALLPDIKRYIRISTM
jgi:hypothetical protein